MFGYNLPYVTPNMGEAIVNSMLTTSQKYKDYMTAFLKEGAKARIKKKKKK